MVEIDISDIVVAPLKSRKDAEMERAYTALMKPLNVANIVPRKHVMVNEVSEVLKTPIRDEYKMELEFIPPVFHRCNAAEVAICNFKVPFISILAGVLANFPKDL